MVKGIYRWHVDNIRDHIYEGKIARYDVRKRESGGTSVVIGSPMGIFGYFSGKYLGRGYQESKELGWRGRVKRLYGPLSYLSLLVVLLILLNIAVVLADSVWDVTANSAMILSAVVLAGVPNLHGRYLAKNDVRVTKELEQLVRNPSVERIDFALENIGHRHERANEAALKATSNILRNTPGKAIKYSSASPEAIYETLVQQVTSGSDGTTEDSLESLVWISRDHGRLPLQHASLFKGFVRADRSPIQVHATLILGNLELESERKRDAVARALQPAATDPDADVRNAAATALGNVPSGSAVALLQQLAEDSDPSVRRTAVETLQKHS
ncbi:HEAT repeat domain-containing protein [Halopiger goleimassiliensis]|uniref:HEAT repeat domain-containing protein n=1 Tax=Halopiger goleimassiliensis TaxID=1293048 RepID=UPI0018A86DB8|nr:HEAT repeat domain-containing protein [Halopiger goleimassiliensis]